MNSRKIINIIFILITAFVLYSTFMLYLNCMISLKYEEALTDEILTVMNFTKLIFAYLIISVFVIIMLNKSIKSSNSKQYPSSSNNKNYKK